MRYCCCYPRALPGLPPAVDLRQILRLPCLVGLRPLHVGGAGTARPAPAGGVEFGVEDLEAGGDGLEGGGDVRVGEVEVEGGGFGDEGQLGGGEGQG